MTKRIIAITFIFICASIAWAVLGATIFSRTYDSGFSSSSRVESTWGTEQNQSPPTAWFKTVVSHKQETIENGRKEIKTVDEELLTNLPLESSNIDVKLDLDH